MRIINAAIEADEDVPSATGANWLLGPQNRNLGSIHSDVWRGTAAELAVSNLIVDYPIIGWWIERPWLKRKNTVIPIYRIAANIRTVFIFIYLIMTEISSKVPITQEI